ncbi:MAG: hypothetical protein NVSMB62_22840 [Acidobacteriaceae bacterium]
MASTTQLASPCAAAPRANPLVLWHLLSLDAPTVAAVWSWFLARTADVSLPATSIVAMFVAVWGLYAADRLLDARLVRPHPVRAREPLELRHYFHHQHRVRYAVGIVAAGALLAALIPHLLPAAVQLYGVEGAILSAWFVILHATPIARRLPKEFIVGAFFACAIFIPTVARRPELRSALVPHLILLGAVFTLNCLFIHRWEDNSQPASVHSITGFATRHIAALTRLTAVLGAALTAVAQPALRPNAAACVLSALLLLMLHRLRRSVDRTILRAAADAVLLTPLLLFPFTR